MDIAEHFLTLRQAFIEKKEEEEVLTTTGTIAESLSCTMRNTNIIINKLTANGWLTWKPQKGRGKRSVLIFHLSLLEAARININRLLKEGKFEEAYSFSTSSGFSQSIIEALLSSIQSQFGIQSVNRQGGRQDILKIPQDTKIHTLDPAFVGIVHEAHIVNQIFDTLIRYDRFTKAFKPCLALAWEEKNEGKEWTFYLRKGVLFHHGRTLLAEDVQYSLLRLKKNKSIPFSPLFQGIQGIEVLDDITLHITLKEPNYMFLDLVSSFFASIIPHEVSLDRMKPLGTGPYKAVKNDEHLLVLEAFPHYFQGRAFLDRIELWQMPKTLSKAERMKNAMLQTEEYETATYQELGSFFFVFNFHKFGPHYDHFFRLAFKHVLDQNKLVEELGFPRRMPAISFLGSHGEKDDFSHSLETAKELLAASNYKGEVLRIAAFNFHEAIEDMKWMKERCGEIGIHLQISAISPSEIYELKELRDYDVIYTGETFEENQELSLYMMYSSENSVLRMALNQEQRDRVDKLLKDVSSDPIAASRFEKLNDIEKWLKRETVIIHTYHTIEEQNYHKALNGIEVSGYGMPDFRQLWVKHDKDKVSGEPSNYSIFIP